MLGLQNLREAAAESMPICEDCKLGVCKIYDILEKQNLEREEKDERSPVDRRGRAGKKEPEGHRTVRILKELTRYSIFI